MFQAAFYQTWKMVLALVIIPILCMAVVIPILLILPQNDWIIIVGVLFGVGTSLFLTLTAVKKLVVQKCTVTPQKTGITVTMDKTIPLFAQNFHLPWNRVKNASADVDANTNKLFIQIKASGYPGNFILSTLNSEITEIENWELWKAIENEIDNYNLHPGSIKISSSSFYSGIWAKLLAASLVIVFFVALIIKITGSNDGVSWYKIIWIGSIGLVFSMAVFKADKREKAIHSKQMQAMDNSKQD